MNAAPMQLSRGMFSQGPSDSAAEPPTNQHLKRAARSEAPTSSSGSVGGAGGGGGHGYRGRGGGPRARSVAASSVRRGRRAFSVVSDEEVIEVDGEPTTLGDEDLDLRHPYDDADAADDADGAYGNGGGGGGGLGASGLAGLEGGGRQRERARQEDPLEALERDTPAARLEEVNAELEAELQGNKDPWIMVRLAQTALGHAKVVWRTMPLLVREEPLLLARAHLALARAYQAHGCDRQANEHGKMALVTVPAEVADTEAAVALKAEAQVLRGEVMLALATAPGVTADGAAANARKALTQLVGAAGLKEPVAWTSDDVEANDSLPADEQKSTIDNVSDLGVVALMAQAHGVLAESRVKASGAARAEQALCDRRADEVASRQERLTERGEPFYPPAQVDRWREQEMAIRDEARAQDAAALQLAGDAEAAYEAAIYCLNHVIDVEGRRLEEAVGRDGKTSHPTFRALWRRSLDFMAGMVEAFGLQGKFAEQLNVTNEILSAFAQYGSGGWLDPARHVQALKDRGALLVAKGEYEEALSSYGDLTELVGELFAEDPVRREVQTAEVLKLRGDVALAKADFKVAQQLFMQALDLFQRHLGPDAGVAQDLLHRIEEVKAYLADTRVMGRFASFPGPGAAGAAASAKGSRGGGSSGGASSPAVGNGGGSMASGSPKVARSPMSRSSSMLSASPAAANGHNRPSASTGSANGGGPGSAYGGAGPASVHASSAYGGGAAAASVRSGGGAASVHGSTYGGGAAAASSVHGSSYGGAAAAPASLNGGSAYGGAAASVHGSAYGGAAASVHGSTYGGGGGGSMHSGGLAASAYAAGSVRGDPEGSVHSLAPGHRLPHLNTMSPRGSSKGLSMELEA